MKQVNEWSNFAKSLITLWKPHEAMTQMTLQIFYYFGLRAPTQFAARIPAGGTGVSDGAGVSSMRFPGKNHGAWPLALQSRTLTWAMNGVARRGCSPRAIRSACALPAARTRKLPLVPRSP